MPDRPAKTAWRDERGISGLETAIILIAFVVVAAVFSYTVLSSGLFSTQESQGTVHAGLEAAQASLELKGRVIALANTTGMNGTVTQISFALVNRWDGVPVDLTPPTDSNNDGLADGDSSNKVVISYIDEDNFRQDLYWTVAQSTNSDGDNLLETGENFQITIGKSRTQGNLVDALGTALSIKTTFTIEIKPNHGGVLSFDRRTPDFIEEVMHLL